jgi:ribosomal protein L19
MAVKRRHWGVDDAFTVRANVGKPGVGTEIRFDVNSPWIKDIKVLRRDDSKRCVTLASYATVRWC